MLYNIMAYVYTLKARTFIPTLQLNTYYIKMKDNLIVNNALKTVSVFKYSSAHNNIRHEILQLITKVYI